MQAASQVAAAQNLDGPEPEETSLCLPPCENASPALDLQRRVSEAALRGFYAPTVTPTRTPLVRLAALVAVAASSWAGVFGVGALLLG